MPIPTYALSTEQLGILAEKTLVNARELLDEAKALALLGHYPRGMKLAVLAGEEFGKHMMCFGAAGLRVDDEEMWKDFHQRFRSHAPKYENLFSMAASLMPDGEGERLMQDLDKHVKADQDRKMSALYVDLVDGDAIHPDEAIGPEEVRDAIVVFDGVISFWEKRFEDYDFGEVFAYGKTAGAERLRYALLEEDTETIRRMFEEE